MRTKLLKASVVFALLAILLGMPLLLQSHCIRPSSFRRIQIGMKEMQVEEILGAKAGCYGGYGNPVWFKIWEVNGDRVKAWSGRYGSYVVHFDEQNRMQQGWPAESVPVTWWATICHRFLPP